MNQPNSDEVGHDSVISFAGMCMVFHKSPWWPIKISTNQVVAYEKSDWGKHLAASNELFRASISS